MLKLKSRSMTASILMIVLRHMCTIWWDIHLQAHMLVWKYGRMAPVISCLLQILQFHVCTSCDNKHYLSYSMSLYYDYVIVFICWHSWGKGSTYIYTARGSFCFSLFQINFLPNAQQIWCCKIWLESLLSVSVQFCVNEFAFLLIIKRHIYILNLVVNCSELFGIIAKFG